jgi:Cu/Ag efflux protein CusF
MKFAKLVGNIAAVTFAIASLNNAGAQSLDHSGHAQPAKAVDPAVAAAAGQGIAMSDGEIKKVDKDTGRLTIKHGPLENLGMPGMTMLFGVKDAAMMDAVKAGDKVKFLAEKVGGRLVVTLLEIQK